MDVERALAVAGCYAHGAVVDEVHRMTRLARADHLYAGRQTREARASGTVDVAELRPVRPGKSSGISATCWGEEGNLVEAETHLQAHAHHELLHEVQPAHREPAPPR